MNASRSQWTVRIGAALALPLLAFVGACAGEEKATPVAASPTAAATQVAASSGATATATAAPAALNWPGRPEPGRQASIPLLGGIPNSPPRATPTPLPAGVTATPPPPAPTPPPAQKQQIAFYVDTVTAGPGESPFNVDANLSCVRSSVFSRGMHIVWRVSAFDNTGTELQADTMEAMVLKVPGREANFRYGRHGETWFWTAAWDVPMDFPLGAVDYTIEAKSKSGLAATFKEIPVSSATSESRLQIVR